MSKALLLPKYRRVADDQQQPEEGLLQLVPPGLRGAATGAEGLRLPGQRLLQHRQAEGKGEGAFPQQLCRQLQL